MKKIKFGGNLMIKKWDIIIIIFLLVISFTPEIVLGAKLKSQYNNTYAQITIAGNLYKNIPLSAHKGEDIFEVNSKYGKNIVIVKDDQIAMIEATCPDYVCLEPGFIKKPGKSIVCLPNRVMIEIKGDSEEEIILSY
ncbi:MAG: NusG domain II-containing protein [Clostridium sp.]